MSAQGTDILYDVFLRTMLRRIDSKEREMDLQRFYERAARVLKEYHSGIIIIANKVAPVSLGARSSLDAFVSAWGSDGDIVIPQRLRHIVSGLGVVGGGDVVCKKLPNYASKTIVTPSASAMALLVENSPGIVKLPLDPDDIPIGDYFHR